MPQTAIGSDVHQTFDVHLDALPQVAFDFALGLNHRANPTEVILTQILYPRVQPYLSFIQDRRGSRSSNSVDVS
jgi:hypothetical protein